MGEKAKDPFQKKETTRRKKALRQQYFTRYNGGK